MLDCFTVVLIVFSILTGCMCCVGLFIVILISISTFKDWLSERRYTKYLRDQLISHETADDDLDGADIEYSNSDKEFEDMQFELVRYLVDDGYLKGKNVNPELVRAGIQQFYIDREGCI